MSIGDDGDGQRASGGAWGSGEGESRWVALIGSLALLGLAASALLLAPLVTGDWATRLGCFAFGLAVLWLATAMHALWPRIVWWPHALVGVYAMAMAVFSPSPGRSVLDGGDVEGALHALSAAVTVAGFAFGTVARFVQRRRRREAGGTFDLLAAAAATALLPAMLVAPALSGILPRVVFLVACAWYLREAVGLISALRRDRLA